jgi:hypothetical protein
MMPGHSTPQPTERATPQTAGIRLYLSRESGYNDYSIEALAHRE